LKVSIKNSWPYFSRNKNGKKNMGFIDCLPAARRGSAQIFVAAIKKDHHKKGLVRPSNVPDLRW